MKLKDSFIYPTITPGFCGGRPVLAVLQAVLQGGVRIVQLRDKNDPEWYAEDFRRITEQYNALFIMNDDLDLALKYQADGVHLGKEDMPVAEARRRAPHLIIGASAGSLEEALAAEKAGATYVNIGPIFPTKTKSGLTKFIGTKAIKEIAPHLKIPFTVMGGISKSNIREVIDAGARRIAMITAITESRNIEETVKEFINMLK